MHLVPGNRGGLFLLLLRLMHYTTLSDERLKGDLGSEHEIVV
jgi:hypothetical protein